MNKTAMVHQESNTAPSEAALRGPPLPCREPLQSSRSMQSTRSLQSGRSLMNLDLPYVQEGVNELNPDEDDEATVASEFEYSIKDGIRFLKSVEVEDQNEAMQRLVQSLYKKASDSVTILTDENSTKDHDTWIEEIYSKPTVKRSASDAFHHGLDKDELMSMVAVLTKQSTFSDMLMGTASKANQQGGLTRQGSFHSAAKSKGGSTKASSMPSLTECSSLASSLSHAVSCSVNSRTPVINKHQLFAMRKEDRTHADSLPQQPARRRVDTMSDCESMTSYQEDDLESLLSRNSSIKADPRRRMRMMEQRSSCDLVPRQPMRRLAEFSDVESMTSYADDESLMSRPSVRGGCVCDRMPRFPQRSCASLSDGESMCTRSVVDDQESRRSVARTHSDSSSIGAAARRRLREQRACMDCIPRAPPSSCTPDSSSRRDQRTCDSVPCMPPVRTTSNSIHHRQASPEGEYWEFPDPTPKSKNTWGLMTPLVKMMKVLKKGGKSSSSKKQAAAIMEDFLPTERSIVATSSYDNNNNTCKPTTKTTRPYCMPQGSAAMTDLMSMDDASNSGIHSLGGSAAAVSI